jgi:short subunit dehydrogenase-like uncharacterized protein
MPSSFLLYGANGYLGAQIAHLAVQHGLKPLLAGRNKAALTALGEALNLNVTP